MSPIIGQNTSTVKVVAFKVPHTRREAFRVQEDQLPYFYDKLHHHVEIQLMWIEASEGTLIAGDYVGRFEAGDLFLLGSNQAHVFRNDERYYKSGSRQAKSLSIYFDESYLGEHFWELEEMDAIRRFLQETGRGYRILNYTRTEILSLIKSIRQNNNASKVINFLAILNLLTQSTDLVPLSVAAPLEAYSQNEGRRMNAILQFTFQQSHRKIYIEEVAKIAHLSAEAFCRYFKTRTGKTYTNFLNEVRISNACKLIIDKDLSIQDVCYKSGFANLSNFNRAFKRVTGKTPSRYIV
ncbi:MAG TPA: AraC family transcriptional regulator [Cyclobacteriaceae bacterium]|nr:AraC family transcriptional regulator [Cyclobacteriaceae bacterium]